MYTLRFLFISKSTLTFDPEPQVSSSLSKPGESIEILDNIAKMKFLHGLVNGTRVSVNLRQVEVIEIVQIGTK